MDRRLEERTRKLFEVCQWVQANIGPQYRGRIAFVRIAPSCFQRCMNLKNSRTGRVMSVQAPAFITVDASAIPSMFSKAVLLAFDAQIPTLTGMPGQVASNSTFTQENTPQPIVES